MKKNSFTKLVGFALVAALTFAGCGSGSTIKDDISFGPDPGPSPTITPIPSGFLADVDQVNIPVAPSVSQALTNPTGSATVEWAGEIKQVVVDGFNLENNGRLLIATDEGFVPVVDEATSTQAVLNRPFQVISYVDNDDVFPDALFISAGAGQNNPNDGRIVRVTNFQQNAGVFSATFDEIASGTNPAFMTIVENVSNRDYVYFTEYASNPNGLVSRIPVDQPVGPPVAGDVVARGFTFPAGIDHNGTTLVIAEAVGGLNGQIYTLPLSAPIPDPGFQDGSTQLKRVAANGSDPAFVQPFVVRDDRNNGIYVSEGGTVPLPGGVFPQPIAQQGKVRFISDESAASDTPVAQLVVNQLNPVAFVDAIDSELDGTTALLFCEQIANGGRVFRALVDTANVSVIPVGDLTLTDTAGAANTPFFVRILSESVPAFFAMFNPDLPNQGIFRFYSAD